MCEEHHFFDCTPSFLFLFCCFLCLLPPHSQVTHLLNGSYKDTQYWYGWYSMWWYHEWTVEWKSEYQNLLQFNTGWLASLRTWYYFRLCFSFSCKMSHTLNCYPFIQKPFIRFYKFVFSNCVAQFVAKPTNSEKAIYFLLLKSCLINKWSLICKSFMFYCFLWKRTNFAPGNGRGGWRSLPLPLPPPVCHFFPTLELSFIFNYST